MKKRLLGLVSIICLLAVVFSLGATNVSAAATFEELTTITFADSTVGDKSTGDPRLAISNSYFKEIYPSAGCEVEIKEEDGVKFARLTANAASSHDTLIVVSKNAKNLPGQDYKFTIAYRLSENFEAPKADSKTFTIRTQGKNGSDDTILVKKVDYPAKRGSWQTVTVTAPSKGDMNGFWLFSYVNEGCYFDIKSIKVEVSGAPLFAEKADFDASNPADVTFSADTKGNDITKVEVWNKKTEAFETLATSNYVFDVDAKTMTIKKEYLATLTNGLKSIICYVNGYQYATVIYVYNSNVYDDEVSLKDPNYNPSNPDKPNDDPNNDTPAPSGGCGSIITATSAVLASALLAGSIVVFKKKEN